MLKPKLLSLVLIAFAFSQFGYAEENPGASKDLADRQNMSNQFWWPERLDLAPLRQHAAESDPMGKNFKYAE